MKMLSVIGVLVLVLAQGACNRTMLSPNWGVAYQDARAKQILNPVAGEQLDPVQGQDGKVSATATEAYRKSFESPDAGFQKSAVSSGVRTN